MRAAAGLAAVAAAVAAAAKPAPNILFILADDLGWHDLGFTGSPIRTPNIDSLLASGARLSSYYGQPVCSPSRTALHSGRYPIAYGLQTYVIDPPGVDYGLNLNETTLPQLLKTRGNYSTVAVGKWHLGMARWEQTPTFRGYNFFHGYFSGGQDYFTYEESGGYDLHYAPSANCGAGCDTIDWGNNETYSTHVYTATAIERLKALQGAQRPWFMYLAYQAVHSPQEVPQHYVWPYNATIPDPSRRQFAGMVSALDEGVGNVTATLKALGMDNNTLIVFVADNGGPIFGGDSIGSSNWPLRGGKHGLYEGGVRLSALVSGPLVANATGRNITGRMHHVDWLPTLLEAAGIDYTPAPGFELHGVSAWPMISQGGASMRNETLLNIDPCQPAGLGSPPGQGNAALIAGDWKLHVGMSGPPWNYSPEDITRDDDELVGSAVASVETSGDVSSLTRRSRFRAPLACATQLWPLQNMTVQLYNLVDDPFERNDVAGANPAIVAELLARVEYWATSVQVPPYWPTAVVDPKSSPKLHNGTWSPWL